MAQQIRVFEKSYIDLDNENASIIITDASANNNGQLVADFVRNRSNATAWITSGSLDSHNTIFETEFGGNYRVGAILMVGHNFSDYTVEYWTGVAWTNLVTVSSGTATTTHHNITETQTDKIRINITGTIGTDQNKRMLQLIVSRNFQSGQFVTWPILKPSLDENKKANEMLSGKVAMTRSVGGYNINMTLKTSVDQSDLTLIQEMYFRTREGFLLWPNGGDNDQFTKDVPFWNEEDILLVLPTDNYKPEWLEGFYKSGMPLNMKLREVVR